MLPRTLRPYKQAVAVRTRLTRWRRPRESGAKARPCFLENVRPGPPFGLGSQNGDARQTIRGGRRAAACLSVAGPTHCACAARVRWPGGAARSGSGCAPLCNCRGGGRGGVSGLWRLAGRSRGSRTGAPASERWCVRGRGGGRRALSGGPATARSLGRRVGSAGKGARSGQRRGGPRGPSPAAGARGWRVRDAAPGVCGVRGGVRRGSPAGTARGGPRVRTRGARGSAVRGPGGAGRRGVAGCAASAAGLWAPRAEVRGRVTWRVRGLAVGAVGAAGDAPGRARVPLGQVQGSVVRVCRPSRRVPGGWWRRCGHRVGEICGEPAWEVSPREFVSVVSPGGAVMEERVATAGVL